MIEIVYEKYRDLGWKLHPIILTAEMLSLAAWLAPAYSLSALLVVPIWYFTSMDYIRIEVTQLMRINPLESLLASVTSTKFSILRRCWLHMKHNVPTIACVRHDWMWWCIAGTWARTRSGRMPVTRRAIRQSNTRANTYPRASVVKF
jgi:hypothetical protein